MFHEDEIFVFKSLLLSKKVGYLDNAFYHRRVRNCSVMDLGHPEKMIFSVFSGFICLKQMIQFCSSVKVKKENEEAVFSNIEQIVTTC